MTSVSSSTKRKAASFHSSTSTQKLSTLGTTEIQSIQKKVEDFIRSGITEWHTHWHGILSPEEYITSWHPTHNSNAHRTSRSAIVAYVDYNSYETGKQIASLKKKKGDASKKFTEYLLASRRQTKKWKPVNWSVAYELREVIRDTVKNKLDLKHKEFLVYSPNQEILDLISCDKDETSITEILKNSGITYFCSLPGNDKDYNGIDFKTIKSIMEFVNKLFAAHTEGKVSDGIYSYKVTSELIFSYTVLCFYYAKKIIQTIRAPKNNVVRIDIGGQHNLPNILFEYLCQHYAFPQLSISFLNGIDTHILRRGICTISDSTKAHIRDLLVNNLHVIGIDIRGPESVFDEERAKQVIHELYRMLVDCYDIRKTSSKKGWSNVLVLRIHVGESNMCNNKFEAARQRLYRKNISIILRVLRSIGADYVQNKVVVRLGHIAAVSVSQMLEMLLLGVNFELNAISNVESYAVKGRRYLPILKILVACVIHCSIKKIGVLPIQFTCNSDGNGVMHSDLTEEYILNETVIKCFITNTLLPCSPLSERDHDKYGLEKSVTVNIYDQHDYECVHDFLNEHERARIQTIINRNRTAALHLCDFNDDFKRDLIMHSENFITAVHSR